jgi:hypothetical protein
MPQGGPHEETRQALPPPGRRYEEQIDEVAVVEVAGPDAEEGDDLTVLDGNQAGLDGNQAGSVPDERPGLLAPAGALGIDDHDGTDVGGLRGAEFSHGEPSRWLDVEAELDHVAVVHHVILALDAHLAGGAGGGH